jgi:hypothetical protein
MSARTFMLPILLSAGDIAGGTNLYTASDLFLFA